MERRPQKIAPGPRKPGIGQCIYCGATDQELTDEHVVPLSFGGNLVVEGASCIPCAKITSGIERKIMRDYFGALREALNFPTRRPKRRPQEIELITSIGDEAPVKRMVPWHEYPAWIGLPVMSRPTFMEGNPPIGRTELTVWTAQFGPKRDYDIIGTSLKIDHFIAFVAKMAHSFVIAALGRDALAYDWLLPPFVITEGSGLAFHYVGGSLGEPNTPMAPEAAITPGDTRFSTSFALIQTLRKGEEILTVEIQLLSDVAAPRYFAVFGRRACPDGKGLSLPESFA